MKFLTVSVITVFFFGCRDYITGIGENELPFIYSDKTFYNTNSTITVRLENKSGSDLYVIGAFDYLERKDADRWNTYKHLACPEGCPEIRVFPRESISNITTAENSGTYRFVCLYSTIPSAPEEQKIRIYSNEFTVQ